MDRKIRRIQAKIRKLTWHQKLILMDWMNAWYSDYKEQARKEYEEYMGEEEWVNGLKQNAMYAVKYKFARKDHQEYRVWMVAYIVVWCM